MARIRTIKPEFFMDEELAELSLAARLLFIGLWTLADKDGRLEDRPKRIKAALFPYDSTDVEPLLAELAAGGFICRYVVGDEACIAILSFVKHQRPHPKETSLGLPCPPSPHPSTASREAPRQSAEPSRRVRVENGVLENGSLDNGERVPGKPTPPQPPVGGSSIDTFRVRAEELLNRHRPGYGHLSRRDEEALRVLQGFGGQDWPLEVLRRLTNGLTSRFKARVDTLSELANEKKWQACSIGETAPPAVRDVRRGSVPAEAIDHSKDGGLF